MSFFILPSISYGQIENLKNSTHPCLDNCIFKQMDISFKSKKQINDLSKNEGIALEQVIYEEEYFKRLNLNPSIVAKQFLSFNEPLGAYFRKNTQLKGKFIAYFTYYPGFKTPYQYKIEKTMTEAKKHWFENYNERLKLAKDCNYDGFCGNMFFEEIEYFDNKNNTLDPQQYWSFTQPLLKNEFHYYPSTDDINHMNPIHFKLIFSTNGYKMK